MKKICLLVFSALMAFSSPSIAQATFGIRGGLNLADNDIKSVTRESLGSKDSYTGFFFGPALEFQIPIINIGADVAALYSQSGMKLSSDENYKQQYISIPVSLKWKFGFDMLGILVHVGPQFDFNVGDAEVFIDNGAQGFNRFTSEKVVTTFNLGAGVRLLNKFDVEVNYNMPLKKKSHYEQYSAGTTIDNYKNAVADINEAIDQKILQLSLTYRF